MMCKSQLGVTQQEQIGHMGYNKKTVEITGGYHSIRYNGQETQRGFWLTGIYFPSPIHQPRRILPFRGRTVKT